MNTLDEALAPLFEAGVRTRVALIDLDSCGVTALDWLQILSCLRLHYDVIGGFTRGLNESLDWLVPIAESHSFFSPISLTALQACDFGVPTGDDLPNGHWQATSGFGMDSLSEHELNIIAAVAS
jgi:hypothetical protein